METFHQTCPSGRTARADRPKQRGGYIVTRLSRAGERAFYTGTFEDVETEGKGFGIIPHASRLLSEAKTYPSLYDATNAALVLNVGRLDGAPWDVKALCEFPQSEQLSRT